MTNRIYTVSSTQLIVCLCFLTFCLPLSQAVTLSIGDGSGIPGSTGNQVAVSLENQNDSVGVVQVDVCDVDDYLSCTTCETTERTSNFRCSAYEQKNGCVGVVMLSLTCDFIDEGTGPIFTLYCDISREAPPGECRDLNPENEMVSDMFGNELPVDTSPGNFCFHGCGDIYPPASAPGASDCGDGDVNLVDLITAVNFSLSSETPDDCQRVRADVPTGTPGHGPLPYCSPPDGVINVLDIMVIIDMALDRQDCCSYYYLDQIY